MPNRGSSPRQWRRCAVPGRRVYRGATWTTDAPFRETAAAIAASRARNILAVEMEAAALYAFARARGKPVLCLAHVTNQMAVSSGDFEKGEADGVAASLAVIAAVAARLARAGAARGDNAGRVGAVRNRDHGQGAARGRSQDPAGPAADPGGSDGAERRLYPGHRREHSRGSGNHGDRRVRRLLAAGFGGVVRGARTGGDPAAAAAPDRPRREPVGRRRGPARCRLRRGLPYRRRQSDAADFRARRSRPVRSQCRATGSFSVRPRMAAIT